MAFREIDIRGLSLNPFTRFGDDWALVTAGDESGLNTMTVSWGQMGTLWGRDVVTVYIRPSRHTKAFVDAAERFTVSFYAPEHRRALGVLGAKSGRDSDKVAEVGFTPVFMDGTCAFAEASMVLVCRTLYADVIRPECMLDPAPAADHYPEFAGSDDPDYHTMYVAEVERVLVAD